MKIKKLCLAMAGVIAAGSATAMLAACSEHYDLVYATWNLSTEAVNNIERQMIKEFEERNDVKIKIEESISITAYDESISALAVKNKLPDVFMLSNINYGLRNQYVADITELVEADKTGDWDKIPKPIEEAVHFKSGIYAIPFSMNIMGYFANMDLLETYNADDKLYDANGKFTYDSFYETVSAMSELKSSGIMGLNKESTVFEWYPASVNEAMGWFTWDGEKYSLDSAEFKDGLDKTKQLRSEGLTYDSLSEQDRSNYFDGVDGDVNLWDNGKLALRWGYSYEVPDMSENVENIKFLGVPGGRTPIVGDYLAISKTCQNKELAYKFAKWMSFDQSGIEERITREKKVTNTLPMTTDAGLIQKYFDKFTLVDGLQIAYEDLDKGIVEGVKVVPGYNQSRWKAKTGLTITTKEGETIQDTEMGRYLDLCWTGEQTYAEHAAECNKLANESYANAIKSFENFYS